MHEVEIRQNISTVLEQKAHQVPVKPYIHGFRASFSGHAKESV